MNGQLFTIIGAVGSILYAIDMATRPPQPRCPKCHLPMYSPGTRYSRCVECGQLIDWHHKGGRRMPRHEYR